MIAVGQQFGQLRVVSFADYVKHGRGRMRRWRCICACGRATISREHNLKTGIASSCGCRREKKARARLTTHGLCSTPEYKIWQGMISRCTHARATNYENYGGRGIDVCRRWRDSFSAFLHDVGPRPSVQHSIDRIDVNGNYEPGNVRWATRSEQARNKRKYN